MSKANPVPTTDRYVEPSLFFRFPLVMIIICPLLLLAIDVFLTNEVPSADWSNPLLGLKQFSIGFYNHLPSPTLLACKMVGSYVVFQVILLLFVPGKTHLGPVSPVGDRPHYKLNGVPCFLLTIGCFVLGSTEYGLGYYSMGIVHENMGEIIITLTISVKVLVLFLYFKGLYYPSGKDNVIKKGDFWYNYFWGVELYPYIGPISLKQLVNCRLGLTSWGVIVLSCAFDQQNMFGYMSNSIKLSVGLQLFYVLKFFIWESGYLGSIDIMHDRFGYYLCWGCLCWVPGYYTLPALWLAHHPIDISLPGCYLIIFFGLVGTIVNYLADIQRQTVRETDGDCLVWNKKPEIIRVTYVTVDKKTRSSLLLASGWWGISRHFHYLPELLAAFCWSVPALDNGGIVPYGYFIMLVILLFDRQLRDEERCSTKYGDGWKKYCQKVPYKIIPYIY